MELYIAIAFIVGLIIGILIPSKKVGVLRIDHSDPGKDIYRFDIADLDGLSKRNRITLIVDNNADLSQN